MHILSLTPSTTKLARRVSVILIAMLATSGCRSETAPQARVLAVIADKSMDGEWDIMLRLERPMSFAEEGRTFPRSVGGRITLLEDKTGRFGTPGIGMPTFVGVYDIDVGALGLPPGELGVLPGVVARRALTAPAAPAGRPDSLFLVMNPEAPRHSLQLTGIIVGDKASGTWMAKSPLGGGGTFVLQRHPAAVVAPK